MTVPHLHIRFIDVTCTAAGQLQVDFDVALVPDQPQHGRCTLPYLTSDIPHLQKLLNICQTGELAYSALSEFPDEELQAYRRANLITPADTVHDDPAMLLGEQIFQCLANTPRSRARSVFTAFTRQLPSISADDQPPFQCMLLDFSLLVEASGDGQAKDEQRYSDHLLALPWEALRVRGAPLPLQEYGVIIVRQLTSAPAPEDTPLAPSVVAIRPNYDITPGVRALGEDGLPRPFYDDDPYWCSLHIASPGLTIDQFPQIIAQYRPHILHYFGHGDIVVNGRSGLRDAVLLFDAPDIAEPGRVRGIEILLDLQTNDLRLLTLFACLSADPLPDTHRVDRHDSGSLIRLLTARVPAILAMQTVIQAGSAVAASQALYRRLAEGRTLFDALLHMRRRLFRVAQLDENRDNGARHAWWAPVIYVSDPAIDQPMTRPQHRALLAPLNAPPPAVRINRRELLDSLIDAIYAAGNDIQLIEIIGDRWSGRTTLIRLALFVLQANQISCLALRARPSRSDNPTEYLQMLQREVVCHIFRNQTPPPQWATAHELYAAALQSLAAGTKELWIFIDNLDDLLNAEPRAIDQLIPSELPRQLRLVISRRHEPLPHRLRSRRLVVPAFSRAEVEEITRHTFGDYQVQFANQRHSPAFDAVEAILFTLPGPLPVERIADAARWLAQASDREVLNILNQLVEKRYVQQRNTSYLLVNEQHRQAWWALTDKQLMRARIVDYLAQWRVSLDISKRELSPGETLYPLELLQALADPLLLSDKEFCRRILPPPAPLLEGKIPPSPYRVWRNLARDYRQHKLSDSFRYPARAAQQVFPSSAIDRAVLELLIFLVGTERPVRGSDALWGVICTTHREALDVWLKENSASPLAGVIAATRECVTGTQDIDFLVGALERCTSMELRVALHWIVIPLLSGKWSPQLEQALDRFMRDDAERLHLALTLSASANGDRDHPAVRQAIVWLDRFLDTEPPSTIMDELRALWISVMHAYDPELRGKRCDLILKRCAPAADVPPEQRPLRIAEQIVLRYTAETKALPWPLNDGWIEASFAAPALALDTDDALDAHWRDFVARWPEEGRGRPETLDRMALVYGLSCVLLGKIPRGTEVRRRLAQRSANLPLLFSPDTLTALGRLVSVEPEAKRVLMDATREILNNPLGIESTDPAYAWMPRALVQAPELCSIWYEAIQAAPNLFALGATSYPVIDDELSASNPQLDQVIEHRLEMLLQSIVERLHRSLEKNADYDPSHEVTTEDWIERWQRNARREIKKMLEYGLA